MTEVSLQIAIKLIQEGKNRKAQEILQRLISADTHNLEAWFWYIESCSTHQQQAKLLEICREHNPDDSRVREALEKLNSLPQDELLSISSKPAKTNAEINYWELLLLSLISAIVLIAINLGVYSYFLFGHPDPSWGYLWFFLMLTGLICAIPLGLELLASIAVFLLYSRRYKRISAVVGIGIPLIFNLIGGNILFIGGLIKVRQQNILKIQQYSDVEVSMLSESVIPWRSATDYDSVHPYAYHVSLLVSNRSSEEISDIELILGSHSNNNQFGNGVHPISPDMFMLDGGYINIQFYDRKIPRGNTQIFIDMPISFIILECNNHNFDKPLYLSYSLNDAPPRSLAVSESIRKHFLELPCSSSP